MTLWNNLRRLFADEAPSVRAAPVVPPETPLPREAPPAPSAPVPSPVVVDELLRQRISARLLGCEPLVQSAPSNAEMRLLDQLQALNANGLDASLIPRLPALLPKLMALVRKDDSSPRELADLLSKDTTMVAEVVRLANSAHYRSTRPIADLEGAVMMLGQLGLAQLVSRLAMRPMFVLEQGRFGRTAGAGLRDLSEQCAHLCAWLRAGQADAFQAYLAGTVSHVGLLAAVRVLDQHFKDERPPSSAAFHEGLWKAAQDLSLQVARSWAFPQPVLDALMGRSRPESAGTASLAPTLLQAERAAGLFFLQSQSDHPVTGSESDETQRALGELERHFGIAAGR